MMRQLIPVFVLLSSPRIAQAQYASPPDDQVLAESESAHTSAADYYYPEAPFRDEVAASPPPESTVRVTTGPAVRLWDRKPTGGATVALDVGRRAAGARFTGSWVGVGRELGLAQYTGELWLDFGYGRHLHPLLGAGGGVAQIAILGEDEELSASTVGVGLLRAGLQYSLPIPDTDARAGVDAVGCVPAIRSPSAPSFEPWLLAVATVTVGF